MEPTLKAKWLAALRGGEFTQTQYSLQDASGHCCLGVLCVVAGLSITPNGKSIALSAILHESDSYEVIYALLGGESVGQRLVDANDGGSTFAQIADMVEATC